MFSLVFIELHAEKWHVYFQGPSYERFECLKEGLKAKSLRKQAEQRQKLLQGLLTTNPKFSLPIIEVDAEKWHVYIFKDGPMKDFYVLKKNWIRNNCAEKQNNRKKE